jgi:hypothetical protein
MMKPVIPENIWKLDLPQAFDRSGIRRMPFDDGRRILTTRQIGSFQVHRLFRTIGHGDF